MANITQMDNELKAKAKKQKLNTTDPVEKVKLTLLERGGAGIKNCSRWFRLMDDDGNRKLNFDEFLKGMREFGVNELSKEELRGVFDAFDEDGGGSINVTEFLQQMQPKMSDRRLKMVDEAFETFDKTGDGEISTSDLQKYDVSQHPKYKNGEWDRKRCLEEFLTNFDSKKHADGKVTHAEFIAYYSAISCSIDNDSYFDLMMRQAWKL